MDIALTLWIIIYISLELVFIGEEFHVDKVSQPLLLREVSDLSQIRINP